MNSLALDALSPTNLLLNLKDNIENRKMNLIFDLKTFIGNSETLIVIGLIFGILVFATMLF